MRSCLTMRQLSNLYFINDSSPTWEILKNKKAENSRLFYADTALTAAQKAPLLRTNAEFCLSSFLRFDRSLPDVCRS